MEHEGAPLSRIDSARVAAGLASKGHRSLRRPSWAGPMRPTAPSMRRSGRSSSSWAQRGCVSPNDSRTEHGAATRSQQLVLRFQCGLVAGRQSPGDGPSGCTRRRAAVRPCVRQPCTVHRSLNVLDCSGRSVVSSRLCAGRVVSRRLYTLVLHIPPLKTCPGRVPTRAMRSDSVRVH